MRGKRKRPHAHFGRAPTTCAHHRERINLPQLYIIPSLRGQKRSSCGDCEYIWEVPPPIPQSSSSEMFFGTYLFAAHLVAYSSVTLQKYKPAFNKSMQFYTLSPRLLVTEGKRPLDFASIPTDVVPGIRLGKLMRSIALQVSGKAPEDVMVEAAATTAKETASSGVAIFLAEPKPPTTPPANRKLTDG